MKLYEAIEYAINKDGIGIIREQRFANYLADLQAYETPAVKTHCYHHYERWIL